VSGGQFGTGMVREMIRLWLAFVEVVGFVVTARAMNPANTTEKIDAWTASFMMMVTSGDFISNRYGSASLARV
jgi:hypothetical protein